MTTTQKLNHIKDLVAKVNHIRQSRFVGPIRTELEEAELEYLSYYGVGYNIEEFEQVNRELLEEEYYKYNCDYGELVEGTFNTRVINDKYTRFGLPLSKLD